MTEKPDDAQRRQTYLRQRMDSTVHELQRRLMGPDGDAWHEVLKELLAFKSAQEAQDQLRMPQPGMP